MSLKTKNIIYTVVLLLAVFVVYKYRQNASSPNPIMIEGTTMGTTYHITYYDKQNRDFKSSIDSLLLVFNQSLSTYIPDSEISQFNAGTTYRFKLPFFYQVLNRSSHISAETEGAFDPTVMPLVNAYGFGPAENTNPEDTNVDSILQFVGMSNIFFNKDSVWKSDQRTQLDFSAIAKGYGVDQVASLLQAKGVTDLFVEIGGEVSVKGTNLAKERDWSIGLLDPVSKQDSMVYIATLALKNRAIATSGNYFNYRVIDGKRYSHTIDPQTGLSAQREILSASIFADDCMTADAWATACMVMGHEKATTLLKAHPEIDAFLIFSGPDGSTETYATPGISDHIQFENQP